MHRPSRLVVFLLLFALGVVPSIAQPGYSLDRAVRRRAEEVDAEIQQNEARRRQPVVKELKDDGARAYVGEMIGRLLKQTKLANQNKVSFEILEWELANAFVTPESKVYVTTGLMEMIESDDELASVIGHELGHLAAGHIAGRAKQAMIWQGLMGLAAAFGKTQGTLIGSQLVGMLQMLRYGRKQELEADRVGMTITRKAGYDPTGMVHFMRKMGERDGKIDDPLSTWLSTHPPAPQRIARAIELIKSEGLQESKILKLSFNIKTDRQLVDLSRGIEGSLPTTAARLPGSNLLTNGSLAGKEDIVAGWLAHPMGVATTVEPHGVLLSGSSERYAYMLSDAVPVDPAKTYLLKARYSAPSAADLRLAARFLDAAGATVGSGDAVVKTRGGEAGVARLELGGAKIPIPAQARSLAVELGLLPGEMPQVEYRDAVLEVALPLSTVVGPIAGNLVPNPGFEETDRDGKLPLRWHVVKGVARRDRTVHVGGAVSLELTASTDKEWAQIRSDLIKVNRRVDHLLSGYLRTSKGNQRMSLGLEFYRADKTLISSVLVAAQGAFPPAEFTRYHGIVFASGGAAQIPPETAFVAVVGMSGYYSTDPCWFDDIALIRVQKP
ncbi:MAG: M48 family metallopeptidase [Candidatus Riflebacteria bacterium]|nr:M48 family metallopeptidase [Candidatus Riflebacteria bacterium]